MIVFQCMCMVEIDINGKKSGGERFLDAACLDAASMLQEFFSQITHFHCTENDGKCNITFD